MERTTLALLSVLVAAGCASTSAESARAAADESPIQAELVRLRAEVDRLSEQLGHLESEVAASEAEGEFTTMTIDRVHRREDLGIEHLPKDSVSSPILYCHVVEWDGFARMKRFTRLADKTFFLEASGRAPIRCSMGTGGVTGDNGATRLTILRASQPLEPGVEYTLRPRNDVDRYRWVVTPEVRVTSASESGV